MPKHSDLIPVYYQGQPCHGEPDHYITRPEMLRGLRAHEYTPINRNTALLKLSTCLPKYPDHKESDKAGWQGVTANQHSFRFRRDYGALMRRTGVRVLNLVEVVSKAKHTKTRLPRRVSYSLTQCSDNNQLERRCG